jgi:hypothetical protein
MASPIDKLTNAELCLFWNAPDNSLTSHARVRKKCDCREVSFDEYEISFEEGEAVLKKPA